MPQKSWLDLQWPVAGIDRAIPYQKQPPYTTPDAVNVRTEGSKEFRERGGSRPGLGLSFRTQLPGPVRMLSKVSVLKLGWDRAISPYGGTQLRDSFNVVTPPTFSYGRVGSHYGSWITGQFRLGVPVVPGDATTKPYELSVHIRPKDDGEFLEGSVSINFDLPTNTGDPLVDGSTVQLRFSGGTYQAEYWRYETSSLVANVTGSLFTDNPRASGIFTVRVTPTLGNVKAYWRNQLVLDIGLGEAQGWIWKGGDGHTNKGTDEMFWKGVPTGTGSLDNTGTWSFDVDSADESLEVVGLNHDFGKDTTPQVPSEVRRDLVVAISEGELWVEDTVDTMVQVPTAIRFRDDMELTAVDREQKLFVADFGMLSEGDNGQVTDTNGTYTTLSATAGSDTTYALEITDADYEQNQIQQLSIVADGDTYRLGFLGKYTTDLAYDATDVQIQAALEALDTIGMSNVTVTGTGPFEIEFLGDFAGENQQLIQSDIALLTNSLGVASATVSELRVAGGAELIVGTYQIVEDTGSEINFYPPLPVHEGWSGPISSVDYRVVRTPKVYTPKDETVVPHLASKGTAPAGCRLVANYRDRIVYAASDIQPNVWYMSRQGDPFDWDYTQEDSGAAIFAQSAVAGQLADPITALIAHGDECLIVGSYNSLWIIRGDPGYGGTMDQLSRKVGIVGPHAWCRTPDDMCVFLSHDGIFVMPAGCAGFPTSLSRERLPNELLCLNSEDYVVTLEYDSVLRGINIMITKYDGSEASHWWFDWEAKSFWRTKLNADHDPFAQHERNAWELCPITLQGGRDGYIRHFNRDEEVDDGDYEIDSYCYLGPVHLDRRGFTEGVLAQLQATLGTGSGPIQWSAHVGDGAQQAFEATAQETGVWSQSGLNYNEHPRCRGVSACVKVASQSGQKRRWFLERVTAVIRSAGRRRVR